MNRTAEVENEFRKVVAKFLSEGAPVEWLTELVSGMNITIKKLKQVEEE